MRRDDVVHDPASMMRSFRQSSGAKASVWGYRWALCLLCSLCAIPVAEAQTTSWRTAMPGAGRLELLQAPRSIVTISGGAGYGYTGEVLDQDDSHHRLDGRLGFAVHPIDQLSIGLSLEGYRDSHSGSGGDDDSIVGTSRLHIQVRFLELESFRLGASFELWAPSADAPGFELSALSPTLRLLAQYSLGSVHLALRVGYRHDRSVETVPTNVTFSDADRVSLGVTDADALTVGAGVVVDVGTRGHMYGEVSYDALVGRADGLPGSASLLRVTAGGSVDLGERLNLGGEVEAHPLSPPDVLGNPAFNVVPRVAVRVFFSAALGPIRTSEGVTIVDQPDEERRTVVGVLRDEQGAPVPDALVQVVDVGEVGSEEEGEVVGEATTDDEGRYEIDGVAEGRYELRATAPGHVVMTAPLVVEDDEGDDLSVPLTATRTRTITGRATTEAGDGLAARVTATTPAGAQVAEVETDAEGAYTIEGVPRGPLTLRIEAEGRAPIEITVDAETGAETALGETAMAVELPPGELRGVVRGRRGAIIAGATITVTPGDHTLTSDDEGAFSLELPPGRYSVHVEADGHREQDRSVTIEEEGVVVLEVHLRRR